MVTDEAQLYTIEGISAALLMVITAYLILSSTSILTPGDTHISDMQLEQLGNDVLKMMDTAKEFNEEAGVTIYEKKQSYLEVELSKDLSDPNIKDVFTIGFIDKFREYAGDVVDKKVKVFLVTSYWDGTEVVSLDFWDEAGAPPFTGRDHYVTVTRWVHLKNPAWDPGNAKTVLLEVYLWRD
jgi:hypothetical protein